MEIRDAIAELEQEAKEEGVPILRETERAILVSAAQKTQPRRILEIGTGNGFSTLLLAETCGSAAIDTIEIDPVRHLRAQKAAQDAGCADRIRYLLGDATDIIPTLSATYDFLYLDGPKGQYLRHLRLAEPLLSPHATICADNVLFRGLVRESAAIPHRYRTIVMRLREYLAYVEAKYSTKIYEEGDGMAVSVFRAP